MTYYSLYNNLNKKHLIHPRVGVWYCEDLSEAEDMLKACQDYLRAMKLEDIIDKISIVESKDDNGFQTILRDG